MIKPVTKDLYDLFAVPLGQHIADYSMSSKLFVAYNCREQNWRYTLKFEVFRSAKHGEVEICCLENFFVYFYIILLKSGENVTTYEDNDLSCTSYIQNAG